MNKVKFNETLELEVLIRDSEGNFGLGSTTVNKGKGYNHVTDMYQNRIDLTLTSDDEIRKSLSQGNNYRSEDGKLIEAVNSILDFWLKEPITILIEIMEFNSIVAALNYFKTTIKDDHLLFTIK